MTQEYVEPGPPHHRLEVICQCNSWNCCSVVADPLWMMACQWKAGEWRADDVASPVLIEAKVGYSRVDQFKPGVGDWSARVPESPPLEVLIEREDVRQGAAAVRRSCEAGLMFLRALDHLSFGSQKDTFRGAFPLTLPVDDGLAPSGRRRLEWLTARSLDGFALYDAIVHGIGVLPSTNPVPQAAYDAFTEWMDQHIQVPRPDVPESWDPRSMEHKFSMSATTATGATPDREVLVAPAYPGGALDWYDFEVDAAADTSILPANPFPNGYETIRTHKTLPTPLEFPGIAPARTWEIEDNKVWWGDVHGGQEDLGRYLVSSFASLYAPNWYTIPFQIPVGHVAQVLQVKVFDCFGYEHILQSFAATDEMAGNRVWKFFEMTGDPRPAAGFAPLLFIAPALTGVEESDDLELLDLVRDQGANMGWAIERRVEHASGHVVDRRLVWEQRRPEVAPNPSDESWTFTVMNTVPDYWVPLLPVRITHPSDPYQIGLMRGRMPTGLDDQGQPEHTQVMGRILVPGQPLIVQEDEVSRSGTTINRRYQLARGSDGRMHLWLGRHKLAGRAGSEESGLRFDAIDRAEPSSTQ